jgi:hypothetical protein
MMKKALMLAATLILVLGLAGCNFPIANNTSDSAMQTAVALNVALTQVAATLTALAPGGQVITTEPPVVEVATNTPEFTPTITETLAPTFTLTPEGVWLLVNENTNCRSGPGTNFDRITTINKGENVQAVAASTISGYYYVKNPYANNYCWLWSEFSTVSGNTTILPVYTPQPTPTVASPTPQADFSLSYISLEHCPPQWAIVVNIVNTGSITWESVIMTIKDKSTTDVFTHQSTEFRGTSACDLGPSQADLTAGESSYLANVNPGQFNYNPSGHELKITVTLYSKNNYTGTSVTKTLTVTP